MVKFKQSHKKYRLHINEELHINCIQKILTSFRKRRLKFFWYILRMDDKIHKMDISQSMKGE